MRAKKPSCDCSSTLSSLRAGKLGGIYEIGGRVSLEKSVWDYCSHTTRCALQLYGIDIRQMNETEKFHQQLLLQGYGCAGPNYSWGSINTLDG